MSTVTPPTGTQPAVLHGIDWGTYTGLRQVLQGERRYRLTYDRGRLEIMAPMLQHEGPGRLLGAFIVVLADELNLPLRLGGSVTLQLERILRGVEPDNCFWVRSASQLRGMQFDLSVDPPPDLAVEIDVTSSSIPRMPLYAVFGVPELWRLDATGLAFHVLDAGQYRVSPESVSFPGLTAAHVAPFLAEQGQSGDDLFIIRRFRTWVRQSLVVQPPTP